ncbi:ribosomal protein S27-domain-containing protein [Xylaria arbuscula]|nr:ribosomal protein S27-domain-containing protein [Xylaria arbuscula]
MRTRSITTDTFSKHRDRHFIDIRRHEIILSSSYGNYLSAHVTWIMLRSSGWNLGRLTVLAVDLLNPTPAAEAKKHKLKTLVPAPRSFFMDVKCPGCFTITTVFSHAQTVVICQGCTTVLCQPTGGKARLTEGCSFRRK